MTITPASSAVFLDKDGTLVDNVPFNVDPTRVRLSPGAGDALRLLSDAGFRLIVVSNQSGVARGLFDESALHAVRERLDDLLAPYGVALAGFYFCPHDPAGIVARYRSACDCRKPAPGLIVRAASDLGISLADAWCVGDILDDIEAGRRAGCRTVLVDNGGETEWRGGPMRTPDEIVGSLPAAARTILDRTGGTALAGIA